MQRNDMKPYAGLFKHFGELPELTIIKKRDKSITMRTYIAMSFKALRALMLEQWDHEHKRGLKKYNKKEKTWELPGYLTLDVTHLDPNLRSLTLINLALDVENLEEVRIMDNEDLDPRLKEGIDD
jgi:hypothetical protein